MRIFTFKPSIGLLVGLLSVATFMATPAAAAHHHARHHHHHGRGGRGPMCGSGTTVAEPALQVRSAGTVCTPSAPSGPVGNSNFVITPNNITMNLDGSFAASLVVTGLPPLLPLDGVATSLEAACSGPVTFHTTGDTDALGRNQGVVGGVGCVPGTYPLTLSEIDSPFQTFTGFIILHFPMG